jgi:hypothetical protein
MKLAKYFLGLIAAVSFATVASAQTTPAPNYLSPLNRLTPTVGVTCINPTTKNPESCAGAGGSIDAGTQGTGSSYNPPAGGSGMLGYLSGIYERSVSTDPVTVTCATCATTSNVTETHGTTGATVPAKAELSGAQSGANIVGIIQASVSVPINISTATTLQVVPLSGTTKIYVTYAHIESAGTTTSKFVYGTGTNCGTGTTDLHPAFSWTAGNGYSGGAGLGPILIVPAGQALCITNSAAVQLSGWIAYTQF